MGEPVTQAQFFTAMRELDQKLLDYHGRQRQHIDERADKIIAALALHEDDDRLVADRVLTIETERAFEKRAASQHGAIAGSVSAGLVIGLIEGLKKVFGH